MSSISPRISLPLIYPILGMVMMTESVYFMILVISASILFNWLSSNSICSDKGSGNTFQSRSQAID